MNAANETTIKTRTATRAETLRLVDRKTWEEDPEGWRKPDGHRDAVRLVLTLDGQPTLRKDGRQCYCAPWLLSGIFKRSPRRRSITVERGR